MAVLFVIRGNDQGRRFELDASNPVLTIGRDKTNLIQLHDTEASRRHAELRRVDDGDYLFDLHSSNGTFINSEATVEHLLKSGDMFQIGRTLFLYTHPSEEQVQSAYSDSIDITTDAQLSGSSRIVHAMSHAEAKQFLPTEPRAGRSSQDDDEHSAPSVLPVMYQTALAARDTLNIDELLDKMLGLIFDWIKADHGCILLIDPASGQPVPKAFRGTEPGERITISKTILDNVLDQREGVLTTNAQKDERWGEAQSVITAGVREAICVPLLGRYDLVGAIYVDTTAELQDFIHTEGKQPETQKFGQTQLQLMIAIAHQAALAIEDTRYYSGMLQAERLAAIGQTVASVSHHIKNILQGIEGAGYLVEAGLERHDESLVAQGWGIVEKNQKRISDLVLDMLTFSKEREPDLREADMNQVVGEVVELMQSRAEELEVELSWSSDPSVPTLIFDPEGVHRAVTNLVTNALDAASEAFDEEEAGPKGRVFVSVEYVPEEATDQKTPASSNTQQEAGDTAKHAALGSFDSNSDSKVLRKTEGGTIIHDAEGSQEEMPVAGGELPESKILIAVEDNGTGVPPDRMPTLFRPFVSNKGGRGTGLGLPVSRKIVEEHGGRLDIEWTGARGSRFVIELPALPSPPRES